MKTQKIKLVPAAPASWGGVDENTACPNGWTVRLEGSFLTRIFTVSLIKNGRTVGTSVHDDYDYASNQRDCAVRDLNS